MTTIGGFPQYLSTEEALARILGGDKQTWHDRLYGPDNDVSGYPVLAGGTAFTGELRILAAVCAARRPAVAVEFGCYRGASLRATRRLFQPALHVAFDHDGACAPHIEKLGVRFVYGDWRTTGKLMPVEVDFAYVDCEHTAEATEGILRLIDEHAAERSVAIVHDCDPGRTGVQDVVGVIAFARAHPVWRLNFLETPNRLAILTKGDL